MIDFLLSVVDTLLCWFIPAAVVGFGILSVMLFVQLVWNLEKDK